MRRWCVVRGTQQELPQMLPLLILVELHLLSKSKSKSARPSQAAEDHKGKKSVETPKGTPKKTKETKETNETKETKETKDKETEWWKYALGIVGAAVVGDEI